MVATEFLSLLGKDPATARGRAIWIDKRRGTIKFSWCEKKAAKLSKLGANIYVVIGDGGDADADITSLPAASCEWDDRPKEWQLTAWREFGLPEPTLFVDTGGKSVHNYWKFARPADPSTWKRIQQALIRLTGSDPTLVNPSRVMRAPGFAHQGTGQTARALPGSGTAYDPDELLALVERLAPPPPPPPRKAVAWENFPHAPGDVEAALRCIPPRPGAGSGTYPMYRNILWSLAKVLDDPDRAAALMAAHSPDGWDPHRIVRTGGDEIGPGTFWYHAQQHGYRREPRAVPPPPSAGPRYLGPLPTTPGVVSVRSAVGTGKTEQLAALARKTDRRMLVLVPRVALARGLAERLGGVCINDVPTVRGHRIVTACYDSMLRFQASEFEGCILALDEAEQGICHLLRGNTCRDQRPALTSQFEHLVRGAHQVLLVDAHMTPDTADYVRAIYGRGEVTMVTNGHVPTRGEVRFYRNKKALKAQLHALVAEGKRVLVACDTRGRAERVQAIAPDVVLVTSGTSQTDVGQAAIAGVTDAGWLQDNGVSCFAYSPSLGTGIDISHQHFDAVVAFVEDRVLTAEGVLQLIGRYRTAAPVYIYTPSRFAGPRTAFGDCFAAEDVEARLEDVRHAMVGCAFLGAAPKADTAAAWAALRETYRRTRAEWVRRTVAYNIGVLRMPLMLPQALADAGYRVRPGYADAGELDNTEHEQRLAADRCQAIADAPPVTEQQAEQLRAAPTITEQQQRSIDRLAITNAMALPHDAEVTADDIPWARKWRTAIQQRAAALVPPRMLREHAAWEDKHRLDYDRRNWAARVRLLELLGVPAFVAAHRDGGRFSVEDPDAQQVVQLVREFAPKVEAVLGISLRKITTDIGLLRRILEVYGVRIRSKRFGVRQVQGHQIDTLNAMRIEASAIRLAESWRRNGALGPYISTVHPQSGPLLSRKESPGLGMRNLYRQLTLPA